MHTYAYAHKCCARDGLCQLLGVASDAPPLVNSHHRLMARADVLVGILK